MTIAAMANTIRTVVQALPSFTGATPIISLEFDNAPRLVTATLDLWGRLTIEDGDTLQIEIAQNPQYRTIGVATIQLFAKKELGDGGIRDLADEIRDGVWRVKQSGVVFRIPSVRPLGVNGDWWQVNVIIPFRYTTAT